MHDVIDASDTSTMTTGTRQCATKSAKIAKRNHRSRSLRKSTRFCSFSFVLTPPRDCPLSSKYGPQIKTRPAQAGEILESSGFQSSLSFKSQNRVNFTLTDRLYIHRALHRRQSIVTTESGRVPTRLLSLLFIRATECLHIRRPPRDSP